MSSTLKDILSTEVKLNENETKEYKKVLQNFLDTITSKMKEKDPLFDELFTKPYYTGSYYENLRVKKADEFDVDLVLTLPKPFMNKIVIEQNPSSPCFAQIKLIKSAHEIFSESQISSRYDNCKLYSLLSVFENNYLSPEKLRSWFQGVVDKANNDLPTFPNIKKVKPSQHGPAKTMYLYLTAHDERIDIDLVPVIQFKNTNWPPEVDRNIFQNLRRDFDVTDEKQFWFLVPKPVKTKAIAEKYLNITWRVHFPDVERQIIHNMGCIKPLIKLVKLLRDKQKWDELASYYIKTVAIWLVAKCNSPEYWKEEYMSKLFIEFLKALLFYLNKQFLPSFIFPQYNLLENIDPQTLTCYKNRLERILTTIEKNPSSIQECFISK